MDKARSSTGIIGGSGLYAMEGFVEQDRHLVSTPYGPPSDAIVEGTVDGHTVLFLPRHGAGHRLLPSEINHRANIYALKTLGVNRVMAVTAVGSLKEDYRPGDLVLPDQYFDRTKRSREHTFFGNGVVAHVSMAEPTCPALRAHLASCARKARGEEVRIHLGGTYVNMEGPAFSTRAESNFYRACGFDVIGMTSLPEAKLAREASLCYAPMAMVTDYDCWHESEEDVSAEAVLEVVRANTALAQAVLREAVTAWPDTPQPCRCRQALEGAVMSDLHGLDERRKLELAPLIPGL